MRTGSRKSSATNGVRVAAGKADPIECQTELAPIDSGLSEESKKSLQELFVGALRQFAAIIVTLFRGRPDKVAAWADHRLDRARVHNENLEAEALLKLKRAELLDELRRSKRQRRAARAEARLIAMRLLKSVAEEGYDVSVAIDVQGNMKLEVRTRGPSLPKPQSNTQRLKNLLDE